MFALSTRDYEQQFGKDYRKPGLLARVLAFVLKILPKVGPMRPLAFEPLTPEAERLFVESVAAARARYRNALQSLRAGRLTLPNTDFDTGRPVAAGQNRLADETYADLLHRLAARKFAGVSPQLQRDLSEYFVAGSASEQQLSRSKAARLRGDLDALNRRAARSLVNPLRKVIGALARSELNDAKVGQPVPVKRILLDDGLDVLPVPTRRHDDSAVSRDLPARDHEIAGRVVLLQECDVRLHVRIDFRESRPYRSAR